MKINYFMALAVIAGVIFIQSSPADPMNTKQASLYPVAVKAVIDKKCYGCHSVKGKSEDAKDALMWDNLPGLPKNRIIATLDKIIDVLDENMMPPEDFVKKYHEARLLPAEKKVLRSWAEVKADSLLR